MSGARLRWSLCLDTAFWIVNLIAKVRIDDVWLKSWRKWCPSGLTSGLNNFLVNPWWNLKLTFLILPKFQKLSMATQRKWTFRTKLLAARITSPYLPTSVRFCFRLIGGEFSCSAQMKTWKCEAARNDFCVSLIMIISSESSSLFDWAICRTSAGGFRDMCFRPGVSRKLYNKSQI